MELKLMTDSCRAFYASWKWTLLVMSDSLQPHGLWTTPWTLQLPGQFMEFSRPDHWNGYPFPSPRDLPNAESECRSPTLQVDSLPAEPQGKPKNTGVGSPSLLHQIFLTQEPNWDFLHCRWFFTNWHIRETLFDSYIQVNALSFCLLVYNTRRFISFIYQYSHIIKCGFFLPKC